MGKLGIWRTAFYFLSTRFLDARRSFGLCASVENGAGSIYLAGARSRRDHNVAPCARMASTAAGVNRRHSLRRKSLSPRNRLLPQRFRRASSECLISASCTGSFARDARRLGPSSRSGARLRTYLAVKRSRCRNRHILFIADVASRMRASSRRAPAARRRHLHAWWLRFGSFLYFASCLGTALGSNFASAHRKPSSRPKFPVHALQRSRICSVQLESLGRGARHNFGHSSRGSFRRPPAQKFSSALVDTCSAIRCLGVPDVPAQPFPLATFAETSVRTIPLEMAPASRRRLRILCRRNIANPAQTMDGMGCNPDSHDSDRNNFRQRYLVG